MCLPGVSDCPILEAAPQPTATLPPPTTAAPPVTNTPRPSPTPEGTVASTTPAPTPVQTCSLKLNRAVNIRAGAGTTNGIVGSAALGTNITISRFLVGAPYLWAMIGVNRWAAVYDYNASAWWADATDGEPGEQCVEVTGWPPGLLPPAPIAARPALGFHVVPGGNLEEMKLAWATLRQAGYSFRG